MPERQRRPRRNRHYRIDHELTPQDLAAYREYLREPRTTNKSAHAWLVARGYSTFSESAVARHRRHFLEQRAERDESLEQARQWAHLARDVRRDGGDVVDGAVILTEVMACRALFAADAEEVSDSDLEFYGQIVSRLVETRARLSKLKQAADARAKLSGVAPESAAPAPAMSEEEKHEEDLKKTCRILRTPYRTPEERAASQKAWEEFNQRQLANRQGEAPGEKSGEPSEN